MLCVVERILLFRRGLSVLKSSTSFSKVVYYTMSSEATRKLENTNTVTRENILIDKNAYTVIREGKAEVIFPSTKDVFYNPVQEFNRDLSVLALQVLSSLPSIKDELPDIDSVDNDSPSLQTPVTSHQTPVTSHQTPVSSHQTPVTSHQTPVSDSVSASDIGENAAQMDRSAPTDRGVCGDSGDSVTAVHSRADHGPPAPGHTGGLRVLEALAASGLRSCRFALEVIADTNAATTTSSSSSSTNTATTTSSSSSSNSSTTTSGSSSAGIDSSSDGVCRGTNASGGGGLCSEANGDDSEVNAGGSGGEASAGGKASLLRPRPLLSVVACDLSAAAVDAIQRNICHNGVDSIVSTHHGDASLYMHSLKRDRYDVIDLDPYGSPVPFLDAALQAVTDGGVLQVTCTDMGVLCGTAPETCHSKYGAMSVRSPFCHEMALRIVLQCIDSFANRYGRYIEPLLSVSVDFYVRLFVRVRTSPARVKLSSAKASHLLVCVGCKSWRLQPRAAVTYTGHRPTSFKPAPVLPSSDKCPHCASSVQIAGPIWTDAVHNMQFVRCLLHRLPYTQLGTARRLQGVLSVISEELADVPLHYDTQHVASVCHLTTPPSKLIRSALLNAGYRVSSVHSCRGGLKTDAPASFVWQILRTWDKHHPADRAKVNSNPAAAGILLTHRDSDTDIPVDFTVHPDAEPESRRKNYCRFQHNPQAFWGPKSRAKTSIFHDNLESKRFRNQGKKTVRRLADTEKLVGDVISRAQRDSSVDADVNASVVENDDNHSLDSSSHRKRPKLNQI